MGFISTSYDDLKKFGPNKLILQNVKGKYIAPISEHPREEEYLLPPSTQLKLTGHKVEKMQVFDEATQQFKKKKIHIFTGEGVNVLLDQKENIKENQKNTYAAAKSKTTDTTKTKEGKKTLKLNQKARLTLEKIAHSLKKHTISKITNSYIKNKSTKNKGVER